MPRIFDRFHRVEGAVGRTHEGTGIGLALVNELARLHGGEVRVESKLESGSTFTVSIPLGRQHLPADKIAEDGDELAAREGSAAFVQETLRWLPAGAPPAETAEDALGAQEFPLSPSAEEGSVARPRILLADDNRDMQEYLQRLLSRRFDVIAASDGEQALEAARKQPPDLVLTDVMMPRMDGFGLLTALRSHAETAAIPIVMLSARAGEEAEAEGLEAGADDYLVKPFTARELLARVHTHVGMHRLRKELTAREQELRRKAEDAEYRYRSMLESISEAFLFVDRDWRICYANSQYAAIIGADIAPLLGKNLWEVFPNIADTAFAQSYRLAMNQGTIMRLEDYYAPLGKWLQVNAYPLADGLSIFLMDVTSRKEKEQKLLLSEKLAATGRLAATIAHEINNPLESVLNLIYLARTSRASMEKIRGYLATAEKEIARVSHIARHTLGFYRDTSRPVLISLPSVVDEVLLVYETRLRASAIEVVRSLAAVRPIEGLKGEFHQVFSNLISNSIDAMPLGGTIHISIEEVQGEIRIAVGDTGQGIPNELQSRAGEPFFTTKQGSGTGLGLWIVNQFVKGWGGDLQVESNTDEASHGTCITITLPAAFISPLQKSDRSSPRVM